MFRISRTRFHRILEDVGNDNQLFYRNKEHIIKGVPTCSLEAKIILPLKALAFGVPPSCFSDYFQMSPTMANAASKQCDDVMGRLYCRENLRSATADDLKNVAKLHRCVHGVDGLLFACIDCTHTKWKNCPKVWQDSLKGKEKKSTSNV